MLHHVRRALTRVLELFRPRSRFASDQAEEFRFHLEMETAENIRRGMSASEARRAALVSFGGQQRFREETRDARGVVAVDNLLRDARYALRRIRRAPAFAAGVIATLGIGIGAAVGIGSIVSGVLLRELPYDKPEQLVRVGFVTDGIPAAGDLHSSATFFHFAKSTRSFTALGSYWTAEDFSVTDGNNPERVSVAMMSPSVFTLLGVRPLIGQLFTPADTSWYGERSLPILISERFWRRRYGADSTIIGRQIGINRGARTVIGVLPRDFAFPTASVDLFYPMPVPVNRPQLTSRHSEVIGRLVDGTGPSEAQAELNGLIPALAERFPVLTPDLLRESRARVTVVPLKTATVAPVQSQLVLLGILVAVVLLIATANVVTLFLLRTERTSQEIAIALSLGAGRAALAQRFVIEGMVLGLASTIVALPAALLAVSTKFGFTEREIPRLHEVSFTGGTAALVLGGAIAIGAAVGLIALTRTGVAGLFDRLRASRFTSSAAWRAAQNGLVAFQVSIALLLLVAAGLLGRTFWNLRNAEVGFDAEHAMTFQVSLPWDGYRNYGEHVAFHAKLMDRLAALPGVGAVGVAMRLPLAGPGVPRPELQLQAGDDASRPAVEATANMASEGYFRMMGIPLKAGRSFQSGDLRGTPGVVVSERLATLVFGTTDVVGRGIVRPAGAGAPAVPFTIVGVVGDVQWERIEDGSAPMVYFPLLRDADGLPADSRPVPYQPRDVQFAIRGTQLPSGPDIQAIVSALDPRVPAARVSSLGALVDDATARVRLTMLLIATAGAAALLLAVIGVYSVVAFAAAGRVREFGIRLALGAAPKRVGALVLSDGLRIVAVGTFGGLVAALGLMRFLRALLYEVAPTSVVEFAGATVLLVGVTMVATMLPARRAARTQPAIVLRGE